MDRDAVKEFARGIIIECAPDELQLFDATADLLLEDLPRAVAGDPRRDKPTASGLEVMLPDMVRLALYLAHHVISIGTETGLAKTSQSLLKRRRERKRASSGSRPLISIEVNPKVGDGAAVQTTAIIGSREFPLTASRAADLVVYVASHPVGVQRDPPA